VLAVILKRLKLMLKQASIAAVNRCTTQKLAKLCQPIPSRSGLQPVKA
jgi:hypothetical protein